MRILTIIVVYVQRHPMNYKQSKSHNFKYYIFLEIEYLQHLHGKYLKRLDAN